MMVPEDQLEEYKAHIPEQIKVLGFNGDPGIGPKRDYILQIARADKIIMMDDDLRFYKRLGDGRFVIAMPDDTEAMIGDILTLLDTYPHVGLVDKFMSTGRPRHHQECKRFNQVLAFNRDLFPHPWPRFRLAFAHEEHDMHLQFLTRGYKTAITTEWSKSDKHNSDGGCSDWRSADKFKAAQEQMLKLWPTIVTVKDDQDVNYNWREAKRIGGIT